MNSSSRQKFDWLWLIQNIWLISWDLLYINEQKSIMVLGDYYVYYKKNIKEKRL